MFFFLFQALSPFKAAFVIFCQQVKEKGYFLPQHLSPFQQWKHECSKGTDSAAPTWGGDFSHNQSFIRKRWNTVGILYSTPINCSIFEWKEAKDNVRKIEESILKHWSLYLWQNKASILYSEILWCWQGMKWELLVRHEARVQLPFTTSPSP